MLKRTAKPENSQPAAKRKLTRAERKQIEAIIRQAKGDGKPHTVQDSIPFRNLYPDGLCRLDDRLFSKTIAYEDVNYRLAGPDDQRDIFERLCDFYNGYDPSIGVQMTLSSRHEDKNGNLFGMDAQGDALDDMRVEASGILQIQYERGNNGFVKRKYVTLTIEAENLPAARARFSRIEADTLNRFKVMGAAAKVLDGKERLAYSKNLGPIIPLVSKNGDEISNEAEALRFTANSTNFKNQIYGVLGRGNIIKDPHEIAYGSCTTKFNKTDLSVHITIKPSNGTGAYGYFTHRPPEWGDPKEMHIMLTELDGNSEIVKSTILGTSYNVELVGSTGDGVNVYRFNFVPLDITYPLIENTEILLHYEDPAGEIYISNPYSTPLTVNIWANWTDCAFPTRFPVAPNLPDISQGDFILALMSMNGLFAYADKDSPNTIKLISIDDIIANVQNNDIIDWSDRVILNDFHRVDMPDASIFTIDDLAQSNILDYDNDDDVKTDTYGTITIRNENIEKETELVSLPFSASENATTDGVNCAVVPIYEDNGKGGANYSECSPRILSGRGAFMSGIARCIGVFDPWMKFGGEEGIVKTRYASYQKVVDRLRIITIRAKLTALDLYNLDYTKPVYIAQFGQIFAIYSVETGENDICDCQLLKLKVDGVVAATYYLRLDGKNEDSQWVAEADGINGTAYAITSNGTPYIVDYDSRLYVDLYEEDGDLYLSIYAPENAGTEEINYNPVILGIQENDAVRRQVAVSQKAKSA